MMAERNGDAGPPARASVTSGAAMDQNRPGVDSGESADVDLLRRCAAGEAGALRLLFERYAGPLADYLYRILGSREDAEEAVADVFVRAWRAARGFKGDASVRSWLYRIALNVGIDRMRHSSAPISASGTGTPWALPSSNWRRGTARSWPCSTSRAAP